MNIVKLTSCLYLTPRQLLLCRVALGKPFYQFSAVKMAHSPPGHHSVIGRPSSEGLSFAEYVVYRGEQVSRSSFEIIVMPSMHSFMRLSNDFTFSLIL